MVLSNQFTIVCFFNVWPRIFNRNFAPQWWAHDIPRPALIQLHRWENYCLEVSCLLHTSIKQIQRQLSSLQAVSQSVTCLPQLPKYLASTKKFPLLLREIFTWTDHKPSWPKHTCLLIFLPSSTLNFALLSSFLDAQLEQCSDPRKGPCPGAAAAEVSWSTEPGSCVCSIRKYCKARSNSIEPWAV